MKKVVEFSSIMLIAVVVGACGGNGGGAVAPITQTGMFLDGPVINIGYRTETLEGVTNALGEYDYLPGETVTFFIGDLAFPPISAAGVVTPLDLSVAEDTSDPKVINMIRLLQTLDQDGEPANGITIMDMAKSAATQVDFDLSVADFASSAAVTILIANAGQDNTVVALVDESAAVAHFEGQLDVINGVDVSLVGTWSAINSDADLLGLAFFDDGTYVHVEIVLGGLDEENGMEWGNYSRNATDGRVTATQTFDSNGIFGLTDFAGTGAPFLYASLAGDELIATIDEDGDGMIDDTIRFQREASAGILGTWKSTDIDNENELLVLIFSDDGTYIHAEVDLDPTEEVSGMEYGTYSQDAASGLMTVTQTFDENGSTGLTDFVGVGAPFLFVNVAGDVLSLEIDEDGDQTIDQTLSFARQQ